MEHESYCPHCETVHAGSCQDLPTGPTLVEGIDYPVGAEGSSAFSETPRGERARERWARRYDDLNGAPEGDSDR